MPRSGVRAPPRRRQQTPPTAPDHPRGAHHHPPILPTTIVRGVLTAVGRADVPVRGEQTGGDTEAHQRHRERDAQGAVPVAGRHRGAPARAPARQTQAVVEYIIEHIRRR